LDKIQQQWNTPTNSSLFIALSLLTAYASQAQEYTLTSPSDNLSATIIVAKEGIALISYF
jgi:hypothetical protein